MRLVVSMQALLCFGSRNKSTCPLPYLSNIFVCILSLLLIHSVAVNNLSASLVPQFSLGSFSPASIPKFCHMFLDKEPGKGRVSGESWKITGEALAGVTASGNGTKDEATAVGCPLFLDMAIVRFISEYRMISESDIRCISEYHILSISSFWP